jgi:transglutaminase-like putative cysteine protease
MRYRVSHLIHVDYEGPIRMAHFNLRLSPTPWPGQMIADHALVIEPEPSRREDRAGPFPFVLTRIEIARPIKALEVRSSFVATVEDAELDLAGESLSVAQVARLALLETGLGPRAAAHYLFPSPLLPPVRAIGDWAAARLDPNAPCLESALGLARTIQREFGYDQKATEADTPVAQAFSIRRGVCQDFAHILIVALRAMGLPAAYVSGYLRTYPPPGQPRLVGADAMHAWTALWCGPQRGWVGLDPTNGCLANADHLVVAMGRDYSDISPIDGIFVGGGAQRTFNSVDVSPLDVAVSEA